MRSRIADLDPLEQVLTLQYRAERWRDEKLVGEEEYILTQNLYFKNELLMMLRQAGFKEVAVLGDFTETKATSDSGTLVFIAQKIQ